MFLERNKFFDLYRMLRTDSNTIAARYTERQYFDHARFLLHDFKTMGGTRFDTVTAAVTGVLIDNNNPEGNVPAKLVEAFYFYSFFQCQAFSHTFPLNKRF